MDNLREMLELTWSYRSRWMFIGIQLGIDMGTLDAIRYDYRDIGDCLREILICWLRRIDPMPTRSAINKAIQSENVTGNNKFNN